MDIIKTYKDFIKINESMIMNNLSLDSIVTLIKKECMDFLSYVRGKMPDDIRHKLIYRKAQRDYGEYNLVKSSEGLERIAPHSSYNYHNLVISNLDSWSEYPKRNKSLVGATYQRASGHLGTNHDYLYLVIPYDNTKVGVCMVEDFWESFGKINDDINRWIFNIIRIVIKNIDIDKDGLNSNWNQLKYVLTKLNVPDEVKEYFSNYNNELTLLDNIDIELEPSRQGFKLVYPKDIYGKLVNNEVWMEDNCILIRYDKIYPLLVELNK